MNIHFHVAIAKDGAINNGSVSLQEADCVAREKGVPLVFVLVNGYEHGMPTRETVIRALERAVVAMATCEPHEV